MKLNFEYMKTTVTIENFFRMLCEWFGYDWNEVMQESKFAGTVGTYFSQKSLFEMYRLMMAEETALAWQKGLDILDEIWQDFRLYRIETDKDYDKVINLIQHHRIIKRQWQDLSAGYKKEWNEWLHNNIITLTDEERADNTLGERYPRTFLTDVDNMVNKYNIFKLYRYKGDRNVTVDDIKRIEFGSPFVMSSNVGAYISRLQAGQDDVLKVYVFLQLEKHLENCYFIIVLNIGDEWFIATDEAEYANPVAKEMVARRGAYRYREHTFEYSVMPYNWLDVVDEKRKDITAVAKNADGEPEELYIHDLKEWNTESRILLNLTVNNLVNQLMGLMAESRLLQGYFGFELMKSDRLLTGSTVEYDMNHTTDNTFSDGGAIDVVVKNMLLTDNTESMALIKADTAEISTQLMCISGSFLTQEKYQVQRTWAIYQNEYEKRRNRLKNMAGNKKDDKKELLRLMDKNIHNLYDDIFAGEKTYIYVYDDAMDYNLSHENTSFHHKFNFILSKLTLDNKYEYIEKIGGEPGRTCIKCNKYELKKNHSSVIQATHYSILCWLAGVERSALPDYYKNYMSDCYWPYYGNTLLDNVNPLYRLKDECSNTCHRLLFNVMLCQRCRTKYLKNSRFKEAVIVLDRKTGKKIEILEKEEFKKKYGKDIPITKI